MLDKTAAIVATVFLVVAIIGVKLLSMRCDDVGGDVQVSVLFNDGSTTALVDADGAELCDGSLKVMRGREVFVYKMHDIRYAIVGDSLVLERKCIKR
jgi:hypothetical protein